MYDGLYHALPRKMEVWSSRSKETRQSPIYIEGLKRTITPFLLKLAKGACIPGCDMSISPYSRFSTDSTLKACNWAQHEDHRIDRINVALEVGVERR
jgi:hypothetical protein